MKKPDLYEVAIKIFGLYELFYSIGLLRDILVTYALINHTNMSPEMVGQFDQTPVLIFSSINLVVVVLLALFLIFKSKTIVRFICKKTEYEESVSLFAEKKVIYEIALIIIGILLVLWTLPEFAVRVKNYIMTMPHDIPSQYDDDWTFIVISLIKIAAGVFIVVYANLLSGILSREKSAKQ